MRRAYDIIVTKKEDYEEWNVIDEQGNTLEIMIVRFSEKELSPQELKELASNLYY